MSTFVSVGNAKQPFRRLLDGIARLAESLPQPVLVQHGHTPFSAPGCKAVVFMGMKEFADCIGQAELVVLHAGAGSVIHAIQAGKVPVVMPRRAEYGEHLNDHQAEFARALAETGRVVVADGQEELEEAIRQALARQSDRRQRTTSPQAGTHPRMVDLIREVLDEYTRSGIR